MRRVFLAWLLIIVGIFCLKVHADDLPLLGVSNSKTAGGASCSQGTTVVARLDGSQSAGISQAYKNFVCGLVSNGLASGNFTTTCGTIFDEIGIFWTNDVTNALTGICNTNYTMVNNGVGGALIFTALSGYAGDASHTWWIDTGYNPSTAAANMTSTSAHISCWMTVGAAGTLTPCMSANADPGPGAIDIYPHYSPAASYFRIFDNPASGAQTDEGTEVGHWVATRTGASASGGYYNGAAVNAAINETNGAAPNVDILLNNSSNSGTISNPGTIGAFTLGAQLSGAQISTLYTLLQSFCHDPNINAC